MTESGCRLEHTAACLPDAEALVTEGVSLSYADLALCVREAAAGFRALGVRAGHRVAIVSANDYREAVLFHALWSLGVVVCPLSLRFPAAALSDCITLLEAELVLVPDDWTADIVGVQRTMRLSECLAVAATGAGAAREVADPELDATVMMTSGTTALPRAVVHSLSAHVHSALASNHNIALRPGDRWLLSLPLSHVGGMAILFRASLAGAAVAVPARGRSLVEAVSSLRPTHLSAVPTQVLDLLSAGVSGPGARLSAVLIGGGPIASGLINRAVEAALPVFTSYGLTETASQVTATTPGDREQRLHTSGKLLEYRELGIGEDGVIAVRGRTLFRGYLLPGGGLDQPLDNQGWFRTGDIGSLDAEGYLSIRGRADNMFISGGENIYPEEIEAVLCNLPSVLEAVVVPIADNRYGWRPAAFIRTEGGETCGLMQLAAERLPRFKVPSTLLDWPAETTGRIKPDRRALRDLAERLLANRSG